MAVSLSEDATVDAGVLQVHQRMLLLSAIA
jgi:hypothetical protein